LAATEGAEWSWAQVQGQTVNEAAALWGGNAFRRKTKGTNATQPAHWKPRSAQAGSGSGNGTREELATVPSENTLSTGNSARLTPRRQRLGEENKNGV